MREGEQGHPERDRCRRERERERFRREGCQGTRKGLRDKNSDLQIRSEGARAGETHAESVKVI
jgi:hypothetical protein